jgi:hypothetical protein
VGRWQRSGLTADQFAEREGVRAATLTWWRWRLGQERARAKAPRRRPGAARAVTPGDFVELMQTAAVGGVGAQRSGDLELELAGGYRVRLSGSFSGETLSRLLDVLEARQ